VGLGQLNVTLPTWQSSLWLKDRGKPHKDRGKPHAIESLMAKWFSVEVAVQAIRDMIVLIGHPVIAQNTPFRSD